MGLGLLITILVAALAAMLYVNRNMTLPVSEQEYLNTKKMVLSKDPSDTKFTYGNSTRWVLENFCPECRQIVTWEGSIRNKSCYHCGYMANWLSDFPERNHRKILVDDQWVHQYRSDNNKLTVQVEAY